MCAATKAALVIKPAACAAGDGARPKPRVRGSLRFYVDVELDDFVWSDALFPFPTSCIDEFDQSVPRVFRGDFEIGLAWGSRQSNGSMMDDRDIAVGAVETCKPCVASGCVFLKVEVNCSVVSHIDLKGGRKGVETEEVMVAQESPCAVESAVMWM